MEPKKVIMSLVISSIVFMILVGVGAANFGRVDGQPLASFNVVGFVMSLGMLILSVGALIRKLSEQKRGRH